MKPRKEGATDLIIVLSGFDRFILTDDWQKASSDGLSDALALSFSFS